MKLEMPVGGQGTKGGNSKRAGQIILGFFKGYYYQSFVLLFILNERENKKQNSKTSVCNVPELSCEG